VAREMECAYQGSAREIRVAKDLNVHRGALRLRNGCFGSMRNFRAEMAEHCLARCNVDNLEFDGVNQWASGKRTDY
jgi:hypothetical protein